MNYSFYDKLLFRFLKENQIYCKCLKQQLITTFCMIKNNKANSITRLFQQMYQQSLWTNTDEGFDFWLKYYKKWFEFYGNKNTRYDE